MDKNKRRLRFTIALGKIAGGGIIVPSSLAARSAAETERLNVVGPDIKGKLCLSERGQDFFCLRRFGYDGEGSFCFFQEGGAALVEGQDAAVLRPFTVGFIEEIL